MDAPTPALQCANVKRAEDIAAAEDIHAINRARFSPRSVLFHNSCALFCVLERNAVGRNFQTCLALPQTDAILSRKHAERWRQDLCLKGLQAVGCRSGPAAAQRYGIFHGAEKIRSKDGLNKSPDSVRIRGYDFRIGGGKYDGDPMYLT